MNKVWRSFGAPIWIAVALTGCNGAEPAEDAAAPDALSTPGTVPVPGAAMPGTAPDPHPGSRVPDAPYPGTVEPAQPHPSPPLEPVDTPAVED
jgi:hypothetical protein